MTDYNPKIILSFQEHGKNGGPYISHKRIMESGLSKEYEFIPMYFPRIREMIRPKNFKHFVNEIKRQNADIFQFTGLQIEGYIYLLIAKKAGVKSICAIRGSTREAVNVGKIHRIVADFCESQTLKKSDLCYAVSEYVATWEIVKKHASNLYGFIYNFFDYGHAPKTRDSESIRKKLNIPSNAVVVISTGRIILEKGFGTLRDIIKCGNRWDNIYFLIVGDGNFRKEMENDLKSTSLADRVLFLGYRNDVSDLLDESDIYLSCTWHETFGNSIIEGSFHGLPVIASNVGGVPEIVADGKSGFLVDKENIKGFIDKLSLLSSNPDLRNKMGVYGKEYVERKFDRASIEQKLNNMYKTMLEPR